MSCLTAGIPGQLREAKIVNNQELPVKITTRGFVLLVASDPKAGASSRTPNWLRSFLLFGRRETAQGQPGGQY